MEEWENYGNSPICCSFSTVHTSQPAVSKRSGLVDMVLASGFKPCRALNLEFAYKEVATGVQPRGKANFFFIFHFIFHYLIIYWRMV